MYRVLCLTLLMGTATPALAQKAAGPTFDFNVGLRHASGGGRPSHDAYGLAAELTVAVRGSAPIPAATLGAITFGVSAAPLSGEKCVLDVVRGGCQAGFPTFVHLGLMAGAERFSSIGMLRVLAGPAVYARSGGPGGVGALLHLDAATPTWSNLALVFSARGGVLTQFGRETFLLRSAGVGVRLE